MDTPVSTFNITITGQQGSGKTTLMNLITQMLVEKGLLKNVQSKGRVVPVVTAGSINDVLRVMDTPEGETVRVRIQTNELLDAAGVKLPVAA